MLFESIASAVGLPGPAAEKPYPNSFAPSDAARRPKPPGPRRNRPDLVILDVKMPVLVSLAGERIAPCHDPHRLLEARAGGAGRDAGAMTCLFRPFQRSDLSAAIDMWMSRFVGIAVLELGRAEADAFR